MVQSAYDNECELTCYLIDVHARRRVVIASSDVSAQIPEYKRFRFSCRLRTDPTESLDSEIEASFMSILSDMKVLSGLVGLVLRTPPRLM